MPIGIIKRYLKQRCNRRRTSLWVSSPCDGAVCRQVKVKPDGRMHYFCPVCKRPATAEPMDESSAKHKDVGQSGRCAWVVVLWGSSPGYILGAMVLAKSMRKVGTIHDLVLLHTDSVPEAAVELLKKSGWNPHQVSPIDGVSQLYNHGEPRFKGVFTKLRALSLTQYDKVICLDIDTLVIGSMDELFDLRAPAANARGPQDIYKHGDVIDGTSFFRGGSTGHPKSWGQCWGINAGVMLMRPNEPEMQQMISEVLDPLHPSHIKGNGPEQDYLSRYWADSWSHIGVEYNFQMHQMYHVLHEREFTDSRPRLMRQFLHDPEKTDVHVIHYSGSLKPWARYLDQEYNADLSADMDEKFLQNTLESFNGYWLWGIKDEATVKNGAGDKEGVAFGPNGKLHWLKPKWEINYEQVCPLGEEWRHLGPEVNIPEDLCRAAEVVAGVSLVWWRETYAELASELNFPGIHLAERVAEACAPPGDDGCVTNGHSKRSSTTKKKDSHWTSYGGVWVEEPIVNRASLLVGRIPEPLIIVSAGGRNVLDLRGTNASGVHAVAFVASGALILSPGADVTLWSREVPDGSPVLIAFNDVPTADIDNVLSILSNAGFGHLPKYCSVPPECVIQVLSGRKGADEWYDARAAADFVKASIVLSSNLLLNAEPRVNGTSTQ